MKAKKLVAGLLAGVMVLGSAINVSAATKLNNGTLKCADWYATRTKGVALSTNKTTITFKATSTDASANWNCISYCVFNSSDGNFYAGDSDDFKSKSETEYIVTRADDWAWSPNGTTAWTDDGLTAGAMGSGYKVVKYTAPEDWSTYLAALKKGVDCTIVAQLNSKKDKATVTYTVGKVASTTIEIPVKSSKTTYIGLTGEKCNATNLQYTAEQQDQKISLSKTQATVAAGKEVSVTVKGASTKFTATLDKTGKKNATVKVNQSKKLIKVKANKTAKKGTKIKVSVKAAASDAYKASNTATLTITVK